MGQRKRWRFKNTEIDDCARLSNELGISEVLVRILSNRGFTTLPKIKSFLNDDYANMRHPLEIPGIAEGVKVISESIKNGEKILVYGDYDVDGITATTLLTIALERLGGKVEYYIPDRLEEGYGLNCGAIIAAGKRGIGLIITVDCGISSLKEAEMAASLGIKLVITDHHQPGSILPQAKAVINPKLAEGRPPWGELAGVGVALKLVQALAMGFSQEGSFDDLIDLAAIGTIADIVPICGENRLIVKKGLEKINEGPRPGVDALLEVSGLGDKEIGTEQISFAVAPRINACGRLGNAQIGVYLLLAQDREQAQEMAVSLDQENKNRQSMEAQIAGEALKEIDDNTNLLEDKCLILASENWHPGIIGIVASRLVEKYYRPTLIISLEKGMAKGSARSILGFNMYQALAEVSQYLDNFGGHEMAAGFSLKEELLPFFMQKFKEYCNRILPERDMTPVIEIDSEIGIEDINSDLVQDIKRLAPFGPCNPSPVFALRGKSLKNCKEVGAQGNHLKLSVVDGSCWLDAIAFKMGTYKSLVASWDRCDIAFIPELNNWQGRQQVQLNIKDIKSHFDPDDPWEPLSFLDRLFVEGEIWLEDNFYRDIVDREEFYTKIVGVTFNNRQETIKKICDGEALILKRELGNPYDPWAIGVYYQQIGIGYLNTRLARNLAPAFDKGVVYEAYVNQVTGKDRELLGVNICIRKCQREEAEDNLAEKKESLKGLPLDILEDQIRKAVLGEYQYHEKQREAIDYLKMKANTLLIMGTGRGKSAVFQALGCYLALVENKVTILIYPLRSLVNDQYKRLQERLGPLGINVAAINGSMNLSEKKEFFKEIHHGKLDIILTTPEFLEYHVDKFQFMAERIGLFVVDEAHHLAQAKRKGYRLLARNWKKLGKPLALAVTATADDIAAQQIVQELKIERAVIENHERQNLKIVDKREEKDKLTYLLKLLSTGERTVIYVNSRKQAYELASQLRIFNPLVKDEIGFYHGGLNSEHRHTLEDMFRRGLLRVMVTTSAFGEGIDIPDIKHVVLFHLSFSGTEFNQLSGRGGRNQQDAYIHLLFGQRDKKLNELILESVTPSREILAKVYVYLREQSQSINPLQITNGEMAEAMQKAGLKNFREQTASSCLAILEDLGLILRELEGNKRYIHFVPPPPGKLDLTDSVRYLESWNEWEDFTSFAGYILEAEEESILNAVNKPISPSGPLKFT